MVALSKSNARAYGVDFTGPFLDIYDHLVEWLGEVRPLMSDEETWECADKLAHAWAE